MNVIIMLCLLIGLGELKSLTINITLRRVPNAFYPQAAHARSNGIDCNFIGTLNNTKHN